MRRDSFRALLLLESYYWQIERRASQSTEPETKYRLKLQAKYLMGVKILLSRYAVISARRQLSRLRRGLLNTRSIRNPNDILTLFWDSVIASFPKRVDICRDFLLPLLSR